MLKQVYCNVLKQYSSDTKLEELIQEGVKLMLKEIYVKVIETIDFKSEEYGE
jgi:hypothetical protein